MNRPDTRTLLEDLFADDASEQFRASAMSTMLGAVRRRKRVRKAQAGAFFLLLVAALSLSWWLAQPKAPVSTPLAVQPRPYVAVATTAFSPDRIVQTQTGGCPIIPTRTDAYALIESLDSRQFVRELGDDGLLGLFAGRAVALVYRGHNHAELIFADESLRNGFMVE